MKQYKYHLLSLLLLLGLVACERSRDNNPVLLEQPVAPVLKMNAPTGSPIEIKGEGEMRKINFEWTPANFGEGILFKSTLEVTAGTEQPKTVSFDLSPNTDKKSKTHKHSITLELLNQKLVAAGLPLAQELEVAFAVKAIPAVAAGATSPELLAVRSQPLKLRVILSEPPKPLAPEKLYMIGGDFGNGVEMIPVNRWEHPEYKDYFWSLRYLQAGAEHGFVWNAEKSNELAFTQLGSKGVNKGFKVADGKAYVEQNGFYVIFVDYNLATITIEPAKVYGIGNAFGGWDAAKEANLFKPEGNTLVATTKAEGPLRIYAHTEAVALDWWRMEFVLRDGKIEYRGDAGDYADANVPAGHKIALNINEGTGSVTPDTSAPTPPAPPTPTQVPTELYMIGENFGNWQWDSEQVVALTPVNGTKGIFWTIRHIKANSGFKWSPVKDWKGDFNSLGTDNGFTTKDGNAFVEKDGLYTIIVNFNAKAITIEPAKVYGIGSAFGGWEQKPENLFQPEGESLTLTTSATDEGKEDGEVRLYVQSDAFSLGAGDWWKVEFIVRNGKIEYRGNGGDQEPRIRVKPGAKVTLNFNAGTGTIEGASAPSNSGETGGSTPTPTQIPTELYMTGTDFGNWQWNSEQVVTFTPVNGKEGVFWAIRHIKANSEFKWSPVKEWKGDFYSLGSNVGFQTKNNNAYVEQDGIYAIVVNFNTNTITIEPAKVYGIGTAFSGWEQQKPENLFKAEGNILTLTTTANTTQEEDDGVRLYLHSDATTAGTDWWRVEFIIRNGKIEYRGNGGDQKPRIKATSGQKVVLDFNAGTGSIN